MVTFVTEEKMSFVLEEKICSKLTLIIRTL